MKEIISLGGGIQSSTLVLMNLYGEISPPAEAAVFADTGWERQTTYDYIDWLEQICLAFDFPIIRCSAGNIRTDMLGAPGQKDHMPLYTDSGKKRAGQLRRQCTRHYKLEPIRRAIRRKFGFQKFSMWIGISMDEVERMKPSKVKYITHRFPLLERRWSRDRCLDWLTSLRFPIPSRSACVGCPYHSNAEWAEIKTTDPDAWADAVDFDRRIRNHHISKLMKPQPQLLISEDFAPTRELFLHESLIPLEDIQFQSPDEYDKKSEECEGGCFL